MAINRKKYIRAILKLMSIVLILCSCGKSIEQQIAEQLELGQKNLIEMNYEEALIAFQKVIELDDKNIEAYMGLGKSYKGQADNAGDQGALQYYELSGEAFQKVIQLDENNIEAYLGIGNAYEKLAEGFLNESLEEALRYYELAAEAYEKVHLLDLGNSQACEHLITIYKKLGDLDRIQELLKSYQRGNEGEELKRELEIWNTCIGTIGQIRDFCEAGDIDSIFLLMQSDEYSQLKELSTELGNLVFNMGDGKGLGLYPAITEGYGNCMLYYGNYKNNLRHGNGYWMGYEAGNNYQAYGQWVEDIPEGSQEVKEWSGTLGETVKIRVITGSVSQGLWNGNVLWNFESKEGDARSWPVAFELGKWVVLDVNEKDGRVEYIVSKRTEQDIMSVSNLDILEGIEGYRQ